MHSAKLFVILSAFHMVAECVDTSSLSEALLEASRNDDDDCTKKVVFKSVHIYQTFFFQKNLIKNLHLKKNSKIQKISLFYKILVWFKKNLKPKNPT
jgi:hypothetical protein